MTGIREFVELAEAAIELAGGHHISLADHRHLEVALGFCLGNLSPFAVGNATKWKAGLPLAAAPITWVASWKVPSMHTVSSESRYEGEKSFRRILEPEWVRTLISE
ncbi:hypothetical protein OG967_39645 [Streptomyces phaeochromogenes]